MGKKPVFVATHPRACSTAFERVFMTRREILKCYHEPFGDAYYYGPERLGGRFMHDEKARNESGFGDATFQFIFDRMNNENPLGKRFFIKDMAQYFIPPNNGATAIAPSLLRRKSFSEIDEDVYYTTTGSKSKDLKKSNGTSAFEEDDEDEHSHQNTSKTTDDLLNGDKKKPNGQPMSRPNGPINGASDSVNEQLNSWLNGGRVKTTAHLIDHKTLSGDPDLRVPYPTAHEDHNPTVWPTALLEQFQFCFLIRHPHYSIPSYYRCTIPPLAEMTGFSYFRPDEAGYSELRRLFDYLREIGFVGPVVAGEGARRDHENGANGDAKSPNVDICVIDADDLLDEPASVIETFCNTVGIDYSPAMLNWDNEEQFEFAKSRFEKWKGFHEDAIHSRDLRPRDHPKKTKTDEQFYSEWLEKYGKEGADLIQKTVDECVDDYEYLRAFAIRV